MSERARALPVHYELTRVQLASSGLAIAAAFGLLVWLGVRLVTRVDLVQAWVPVVLIAGMAVADLVSGLIHWAADTWGRDDLPVIGHRLLLPFRVHHVNPDDFLRRRFIDTNGEVALVTVPALLASLAIPLHTMWGASLAVFVFSLTGVGMMTNQIHQWAHMPRAPRIVRFLQAASVILPKHDHDLHHAGRYDRWYCITTGWCNRSLEAIGFFRRLEKIVTVLTGARPREDDGRHASLVQQAAQPRPEVRSGPTARDRPAANG